MEPRELIDPATGEALVVPRGVFTDNLRQSVEAIAGTHIPPGKKGAILAVADRDGLRAGAVMRLDKDGNWKLAAEASKSWSGPVSGKIVLVGSF